VVGVRVRVRVRVKDRVRFRFKFYRSYLSGDTLTGDPQAAGKSSVTPLGIKVPLKTWVETVHLWSVKNLFEAIVKTTGLSPPAVSKINALNKAIRNECVSNPSSLGGRGTVTQIAEAENGHTQKGRKGRLSTVMLDVWEVIDQDSGLMVVSPFKKLSPDGSRRFSPAKADEVLPLVTRFVSSGGWIVSDRQRAYRFNLSALRYKHIALFVHSVDHKIHPQTMEGA